MGERCKKKVDAQEKRNPLLLKAVERLNGWLKKLIIKTEPLTHSIQFRRRNHSGRTEEKNGFLLD